MSFRLDSQDPNGVSQALGQGAREELAGHEQPIGFETEGGVPVKIPSQRFAGDIFNGNLGAFGQFGSAADGMQGKEPVMYLKKWAGQWGTGPFGPGMGGEPA